MKRMVVAGLLFAAALHAQTVAGVWQGTLPVAATAQGQAGGSGLRIAITVGKKPDGSLRGVMALIDRGNTMPLSSTTFSAPNVLFALGDDVSFRGKLSTDGHSIAGTWTQGPRSFPLTLSLATADTLWKREGPEALPPMAADADPSYEVATIKPSNPDLQHSLYDLHARDLNGTGFTATELIKIAYNIRGRQVLGGPSWLNQTRYDIVAKPDAPGQPSVDQTRSMVHKLLIERFHLVSHTSQQEYPVLALTLDPKRPPPTPSDPKVNSSGMFAKRDGEDLVLTITATTMHDLIGFVMNTFQAKQLVDETGLKGTYDITLRVAGVAQGRATDEEIGNALVIAAEHAGFKLVPRKGLLPVVIVEHIDPPTPN
jgi:uncharacterized protein (TIGR03435 family)